MSYPEFSACNVPPGELTVKEGSFSVPYSNLKYQHYFSPERFRNFIIKAQCSENLKFLIDIHRYNQLWDDNIVRDREDNRSVLSCNWKRIIPSAKLIEAYPELKDRSKDKKIQDRPIGPTGNPLQKQRTEKSTRSSEPPTPYVPDVQPESKETSPVSSLASSRASNLNESIKHLDLDDVSSIVNPERSTGRQQEYSAEVSPFSDLANNPDRRSGLYSTHVASSSSGSASDLSSTSDESSTSSSFSSSSYVSRSTRKLHHAWKNIVHTYFESNSPRELNLPCDVIRSILIEDSKYRTPNPKVLIRAKKMVLSLLRQNVYWQFIRSAEAEVAKEIGETEDSLDSPELHNQGMRGPAGVVFRGTQEGVLNPDTRSSPQQAGFLRFYHGRIHARNHSKESVRVPAARGIHGRKKSQPMRSPGASITSISSSLSSESSSPPLTMIPPSSAKHGQGWPQSLSHKSASVFELVPRFLNRTKSHNGAIGSLPPQQANVGSSKMMNCNSSTSTGSFASKAMGSESTSPVGQNATMSATNLAQSKSSSSTLSEQIKSSSRRIFHRHKNSQRSK